MNRYLEFLLNGAEKRTEDFLRRQVMDPDDVMYGGLRQDEIETKPTIYALTAADSCLIYEGSRFYHSEMLLKRISLALDFIGRMQRGNGSFDYGCCNFISAPDTSFCFKRLIAGYRILVRYDSADVPMLHELREKYLAIMHRALEAIRDGGFHTPNHRWGITAALLQGANLFREEVDFARSLRDRAGLYLAEGIDGDADGEYAERSTGNYNAVVNNSMIAMYEETGDESFLGYVRRNLHMMLYYIDPDDTIFTENSTRQDQGARMYADKYFYQYLYIAAHDMEALMTHSGDITQSENLMISETDDKNGFASGSIYDGSISWDEINESDAAAHKIIKDCMQRGNLAPDCFHIILNHPEMLGYNFRNYGYPETYRRFFKDAGVLRVKTRKFSYTVVNGKSTFLYFKKGSFLTELKIGEAYADIRNFIPSDMEVRSDGFTLSGIAKGWYYLPWREKPETSDWWKMDHGKREKIYPSEIRTSIVVKEDEDGLIMTLRTEGLDRLPMRVELNIPAGTIVENDAFYLNASAGQGMILRRDKIRLSSPEGETLTFGPGFGEHEFKGHYSGEEINKTGYVIYCNAYTPFEKTFSLMVEDESV